MWWAYPERVIIDPEVSALELGPDSDLQAAFR
jgi:hypothetical protein